MPHPSDAMLRHDDFFFFFPNKVWVLLNILGSELMLQKLHTWFEPTSDTLAAGDHHFMHD